MWKYLRRSQQRNFIESLDMITRIDVYKRQGIRIVVCLNIQIVLGVVGQRQQAEMKR